MSMVSEMQVAEEIESVTRIKNFSNQKANAQKFPGDLIVHSNEKQNSNIMKNLNALK